MSMSPTLELARELIRRPSVTPDDAGCQALMAERLATLGFRIEDMPFGEVANLWARRGTEDQPFFDIWSPDGELLGCTVLEGVGPKSRSWEFEVCDGGILAYDTDPVLFQKVYIIGTEDVRDEP